MWKSVPMISLDDYDFVATFRAGKNDEMYIVEARCIDSL